MFACRNLNLSYKGNKILKDIHFHIPEGTVFCITGESGSGKSSLLKVINGIIPEITEAEISGEIKLNDMRLNGYGTEKPVYFDRISKSENTVLLR